MELSGELLFSDGRYWMCHEAGEWMCPLEVGDRVEVFVGGKWLAVTVQNGGYLCTGNGRRLLPAQLLSVRLTGC